MDGISSGSNQTPDIAGIASKLELLESPEGKEILRAAGEQARAWMREYAKLFPAARAGEPPATQEALEVAARTLEPVPIYGRGFPFPSVRRFDSRHPSTSTS